MNHLQKIIFSTLWDYEQAGILNPTIEKDTFLSSNFFKLSSFQNPKLKLEQKVIENQIDKKIVDQLYPSIEDENQNVVSQEVILEIENLANLSKDISALENCIINFKKFHSLKGSNKLLLGTGNSNSKILFISEPPSYEEELQQQPYVEECKELFEKIIEAMGLVPLKKNNCNIFVIPSIPFRLVKNSDDKISDLELMKPFLKRYIEIISPKYLILISKMPANILGINDFIKFNNINGYIGNYLGIPTIEIEGIRSIINNPEKKRKTWNNLKLIIKLMKKENEF